MNTACGFFCEKVVRFLGLQVLHAGRRTVAGCVPRHCKAIDRVKICKVAALHDHRSMQPDRTALLTRLMRERILVMDGAMGTMIQQCKLSETDFRGGFHDHSHDLKGDNDLLVLTQPDVVRAIHDAYLAAGADIIETNTFSATAIAQADYGMQGQAYAINHAAATHRARVRRRWTARTPDKPRFVAGAHGTDQSHGVDLARRQRPGRAQRELRRARRRRTARRSPGCARAAPTSCSSRRSSTR